MYKNQWCFNVSKNSNPVWISDYEDWLKWFKTKFNPLTCEYHYEKGKHGKLHIHGYVAFKKPINLTPFLFRKKGWKVTISEPKDLFRWLRYIRKDTHKETNIINTEHNLYTEYKERLTPKPCFSPQTTV